MKPYRPESKTRNLQLRIGLTMLSLLILFSLLLLIFRWPSLQMSMLDRMQPASAGHLLGTGDLGRDLVSCILAGVGISLLIALAVVLVTAVFGTLLGMVSGYWGGRLDAVIMRIVDIFMAFPGILLAIALAIFLDRGVLNLFLVLTVTGWVGYARLVRAEVLKYKHQPFILAARSYNASTRHIIFHHLLPLVLPLVLIQASLSIAGVILAESSLNFLGIGLDPQTPTLGQLIEAGRHHMFAHPLLIAAPGAVLFVIIISFNFIAEGLSRVYAKH